MVFVKVRETYDLHTVQNKMTVISIHTPNPDIIKRNFPGLLMQCRAYRPVSADVRVACASVLPLDPRGVGLTSNDVAPEDVFNPILYKALSNKGMSQLEARINAMSLNPTIAGITLDVQGSSADAEVDDFTSKSDEFGVYYGLLSNAHGWRHANPQAGLSMSGLKPYVYEMNYAVGDQLEDGASSVSFTSPNGAGTQKNTLPVRGVLGKAKPFPFINCTSFSQNTSTGFAEAGFPQSGDDAVTPANCEIFTPWLNVVVGAIIVPPSRLHELFYRMVVEWTIEFSSIRPLSDIVNWSGLEYIGNHTHYQNYSYAATKEALTGDSDSILENDACMVSSNVDINKVM